MQLAHRAVVHFNNSLKADSPSIVDPGQQQSMLMIRVRVHKTMRLIPRSRRRPSNSSGRLLLHLGWASPRVIPSMVQIIKMARTERRQDCGPRCEKLFVGRRIVAVVVRVCVKSVTLLKLGPIFAQQKVNNNNNKLILLSIQQRRNEPASPPT